MLKKSALALAILTLAAGTQAAELSAGKDTKFEVNVEVGAYHLSKKDATGVAQKEFMGKGLNQVEIKATHNLGDGWTVFGEIEVDYDPIVDNNGVQTDDARLGFAHNNFGRFSVGQFDSYFEDNVIEVLGVGHGDAAYVTEPSSSNDGRHLQYQHKIGDLTFAADYTFSNNAAKDDPDNGLALAVAYKLGDITLAVGHSNHAKYKSDTSATTKVDGVTGLSAIYKSGPVKLSALYATEKSDLGVKTNYLGAALVYTLGQFDLGFALQNVDKDGAAKRTEWSAGVGYNVFKGMQVYFDLNGLDKANNEGNAVEVGVKYAF
jgi:predicted porin